MKRLPALAGAVLPDLPWSPAPAAAQTGGNLQTPQITNNTDAPITIDLVDGIRAQEGGDASFQTLDFLGSGIGFGAVR